MLIVVRNGGINVLETSVQYMYLFYRCTCKKMHKRDFNRRSRGQGSRVGSTAIAAWLRPPPSPRNCQPHTQPSFEGRLSERRHSPAHLRAIILTPPILRTGSCGPSRAVHGPHSSILRRARVGYTALGSSNGSNVIPGRAHPGLAGLDCDARR